MREVIAELETTGVLATATAGDGEEEIPDSREADLARREQQVAEQHRIVTEQYRLLRLRESQLAASASRVSAPPPPVSAPASSVIRTPVPMAATAARAPEIGHGRFGCAPDIASQASSVDAARRGMLAAGQAASREMNRSNVGLLDKDGIHDTHRGTASPADPRGWARVGVVGLGYVGLPLAVEFARTV